MVDKDGKDVKQVKPILIKKEINTDYATQVPFKLGPGEDIFLFTDEEQVPYADKPYESEEETDDDSYLEDDIPIEVDSDSSAALSMTDDDFETTDPTKIDQALQQIVQGLHQAADGYENLRNILPTVLMTDVVGIVQIAPTLYLQPMSKAAIQALQILGEEHLINQACLVEFEKGVSQAALMRKYGIGRDRRYKVIHGKIRPGGMQYQTRKKEGSAKIEVKTEPGLNIPTPIPRGRG